MSRRILSALLALVLVTGFATVAMADVQGSFNIDIALTPEGKQTEAVKFEIDFQTNLVVNVTLSGLTFGADIGFGVTGLEFAVLSLTTSLGALQVFDEFVFAPPFGCSDNFASLGSAKTGSCAGTNVVPVGASGGHAKVDNAVGFVKKRIQLTLNIAGITLENLAIFEDVDFPDIQKDTNTTPGHEHDHFGNTSVATTGTTPNGAFYFVDQLNDTVDDATPTFGFGDVISISGQTVSGITVSGTTAICAADKNFIKKKSWDYEVNKGCADAVGNGGLAVGGGTTTGADKTGLAFDSETLELGNIVVGGVTFTVKTVWKPSKSISSTVTATFDVLGLATAVATFTSDNITNLTLSKIVVDITSGNLDITLTDTGGDLDIDTTKAVLTVTLNPNQSPATFISTVTTTKASGITAASFSLDITRGILTVGSTTSFSGTGTLNWTKTSVNMSVDGGAGITVSFDTSYTPTGIGESTFNLSVSF